jgi:hypothetical protein
MTSTGSTRTSSNEAEPLTVARCPMTFQSVSSDTPGASRRMNATTSAPASSRAVTPIQRAVSDPVV